MESMLILSQVPLVGMALAYIVAGALIYSWLSKTLLPRHLGIVVMVVGAVEAAKAIVVSFLNVLSPSERIPVLFSLNTLSLAALLALLVSLLLVAASARETCTPKA